MIHASWTASNEPWCTGHGLHWATSGIKLELYGQQMFYSCIHMQFATLGWHPDPANSCWRLLCDCQACILSCSNGGGSSRLQPSRTRNCIHTSHLHEIYNTWAAPQHRTFVLETALPLPGMRCELLQRWWEACRPLPTSVDALIISPAGHQPSRIRNCLHISCAASWAAP